MGLIYDHPDLAALTLTRRSAEESEGPGSLEWRMLEYLSGLEQRNGTAYREQGAITSPGSISSYRTTWPGPQGQT
ncbi:MAG: hypothetical protein JWO49_2668 [Arthrobacter sp.]|nr:hypothetical protein [Arthrobacter sp.]